MSNRVGASGPHARRSEENRLLAALPPEDYAQLLARSDLKSYKPRDLIFQAGAEFDYVYFPRIGVLSSVKIMVDGRSAEVAAVGFEGMIGIAAALNVAVSLTKVYCQIPAEVVRVPLSDFASVINRSPGVRNVMDRYIQYVVESSAQMIACNVLHNVEERCARWLLMSHDRARSDEFAMTQDFLAVMLGVHRPSVTLAAGSLQNAGIITYRHGRMSILDRERLEETSCECYQAIQDEYERQFP